MARKSVAIIQSNYIPWKGYFDIIHDVDLFIFHDDLLYTKNDWRNRNKIKTPRGTVWLTIPVGSPGGRLICDVAPSDSGWQDDHWRRILEYYRRAPYFEHFKPVFEEVYCGTQWQSLSALNQTVIKRVAIEVLGCRTQFADSRDLAPSGQKLDRVIDLVKKSGCDKYVSGPSAQEYIVPERFAEIGVDLEWKDYSGYPEYPQFFPPFDHTVTILDLLFHVGPDAPEYIWGKYRSRVGRE